MGRWLLLKQTLKLIVTLFAVFSLLRIVSGEPIDRHFIAGFVGGSVALLFCMVFLVPLLSPHVTPNPQLLWRLWQHAKRRRGMPPGDAGHDRL
jgi:hypothetical protein